MAGSRKGAAVQHSAQPCDGRGVAVAPLRLLLIGAWIIVLCLVGTQARAYIGGITSEQAGQLDAIKQRAQIGPDGGCASDASCPSGTTCYRKDHWSKWACMAPQSRGRGRVVYVPVAQSERAAASPAGAPTSAVPAVSPTLRAGRPLSVEETRAILNGKRP